MFYDWPHLGTSAEGIIPFSKKNALYILICQDCFNQLCHLVLLCQQTLFSHQRQDLQLCINYAEKLQKCNNHQKYRTKFKWIKQT